MIGLVLFLGVPLSAPAVAQQAAPAPEAPGFNTLRTPTSPAFTLLGVEPAAVERPNSPSSLALSLLGHARELDTVPENFALEVSPYWLVGHPRLAWTKERSRTIWESFVRTATVSVATGQIGTDALPATGLAIGARASLYSGDLTPETEARLARLQSLLQAQAAHVQALMADRLLELGRLVQQKKITLEQHDELVKALTEETIASRAYLEAPESKAVRTEMNKFASNREGFFFEVATAADWRYPRAVWQEGRFDRWGIWATPSYQTAAVSATGVIRYLSTGDDDEEAAAIDVGVRATHSSDRYAISLEYVRRSFRDTDLDARFRLVGIAEYEVRESTWFVVSLGRDHNTRREGSVVARLGLSFNFSRERYDFEELVAR